MGSQDSFSFRNVFIFDGFAHKFLMNCLSAICKYGISSILFGPRISCQWMVHMMNKFNNLRNLQTMTTGLTRTPSLQTMVQIINSAESWIHHTVQGSIIDCFLAWFFVRNRVRNPPGESSQRRTWLLCHHVPPTTTSTLIFSVDDEPPTLSDSGVHSTILGFAVTSDHLAQVRASGRGCLFTSAAPNIIAADSPCDPKLWYTVQNGHLSHHHHLSQMPIAQHSHNIWPKCRLKFYCPLVTLYIITFLS